MAKRKTSKFHTLEPSIRKKTVQIELTALECLAISDALGKRVFKKDETEKKLYASTNTKLFKFFESLF